MKCQINPIKTLTTIVKNGKTHENRQYSRIFASFLLLVAIYAIIKRQVSYLKIHAELHQYKTMINQLGFTTRITAKISHGFDPAYKPQKQEILLPNIVLRPSGTFKKKLPNGMTISVTYQKVAKGYGNVPGHNDLQVKRTPSIQRNPRTVSQVQQRDRFSAAISAWKSLTEAEKASWEMKARPKKLTGYTLFMSQNTRKPIPII